MAFHGQGEPPEENKSRQTDRPIWAQQSDEPDRWFARFEVFRALGPRRSLAETYRLVAKAEGLTGKRPDKHWTRRARLHNWRKRAGAWDAAERTRLRRLEAERRFDAREVRLGMIDHLLEAVFQVLAKAEMDKMERDEARSLLPTLRIFFKDLLAAQRMEWHQWAEMQPAQDAPTEVTLHAEDLLQAQAALERWQTERDALLRNGESKAPHAD